MLPHRLALIWSFSLTITVGLADTGTSSSPRCGTVVNRSKQISRVAHRQIRSQRLHHGAWSPGPGNRVTFTNARPASPEPSSTPGRLDHLDKPIAPRRSGLRDPHTQLHVSGPQNSAKGHVPDFCFFLPRALTAIPPSLCKPHAERAVLVITRHYNLDPIGRLAIFLRPLRSPRCI